MSKLKSALWIALAALSLAGSVQVIQAEAPAQASRDTLTVGVDPWPGFGILYIAEARGFFQEQGIDVQLVPFDASFQTTQAFAEKRIDGGVSTLSDAIALAAAGVPLRVVWLTDQSIGGDVLVSNYVERLTDLRGKRIGMAYGTFGQVFTLALLKQAGLQASDFTMISLDPSEVPDALAAGVIDAGHTYAPFTQQAVEQGAFVLGSSAELPGMVIDVIAFQQQSIEADPDRIQRFVQALSAAQVWWAANPEEGNALVGERIGLSPDEMRDSMTLLRLYSASENSTAMDPAYQESGSAFVSGKITVEIFMETGLIKEAVDVQAILDPSFVQSLQQQAR
jgi:NitT/TauT family transport system substrate-binding protein